MRKIIYMGRSQGLPLNTIVLASLAVLVLLLIVGFVTGGLSKLFPAINTQMSNVDLENAKAICSRLCNDLKERAASGTLTTSDAQNSDYAKQVFYWDLNKDGSFKKYHCWESPINEQCIVNIKVWDPTTKQWTYKTCSGSGSSYKCS